jgi:hypothetical protein
MIPISFVMFSGDSELEETDQPAPKAPAEEPVVAPPWVFSAPDCEDLEIAQFAERIRDDLGEFELVVYPPGVASPPGQCRFEAHAEAGSLEEDEATVNVLIKWRSFADIQGELGDVDEYLAGIGAVWVWQQSDTRLYLTNGAEETVPGALTMQFARGSRLWEVGLYPDSYEYGIESEDLRPALDAIAGAIAKLT